MMALGAFFALLLSSVPLRAEVVPGSKINEEAGIALRTKLMSIKSTDHKVNAVEMNKELQARGLPLINVDSPQFKLEEVRGSDKLIFGAKIIDGNGTWCLPCSINGKMTYGINLKSEANEEVYECNGSSYLVFPVKGPDGKTGKAFCEKKPGRSVVVMDECLKDESPSTIACQTQYTQCGVPKAEAFPCSQTVRLPNGKTSSEFVMINCSNGKGKLFCPRATYEYAGYAGCDAYQDVQNLYASCKDEYVTWKKQNENKALPVVITKAEEAKKVQPSNARPAPSRPNVKPTKTVK